MTSAFQARFRGSAVPAILSGNPFDPPRTSERQLKGGIPNLGVLDADIIKAPDYPTMRGLLSRGPQIRDFEFLERREAFKSKTAEWVWHLNASTSGGEDDVLTVICVSRYAVPRPTNRCVLSTG